MKKADIEGVAAALRDAGVHFLVVGGLAVVHYGYGRFTQDFDMVIDLQRETILKTFQALQRLGYQPAVPVTAEQLSDPAQRTALVQEKGMTVLHFWSNEHKETGLDLFVDVPFEFAREWARSDRAESSDGVVLHIVSLDTLIAMKLAANRPQDIADVAELRRIHGKTQ
jgi:predicted nucleotidyltransferase